MYIKLHVDKKKRSSWWTLHSENHQVVATSEMYSAPSKAKRGAASAAEQMNGLAITIANPDLVMLSRRLPRAKKGRRR